MNEESLQQLFSALRKAPAETSMQDVTEWLNHPPPNPSFTKEVETLISKKIILMTSSIVVIITGAVLFFLPAREPSSVLENQSALLPASPLQGESINIDSFSTLSPEDTSAMMGKPQHSAVVSTPDETSLSIVGTEEIKTSPTHDSNLTPTISHTSNSISDPKSLTATDTTGTWVTSAKELAIDTLFSGVTKLILKGDFPTKIKAAGESRNTVALQYRYEDRKKGFFIGKSPGCKVSYTKSGTTLLVTVEIKQKTIVGVSFGDIRSEILFTVPSGIGVSLESSYGDIDVAQLAGGDLEFITKYGDIKAERISGNIKLQSGYGDITAQDISGKFDLITKYGDIKASKTRFSDSIYLSSGYGDIDCQLLNGEDSCQLNLRTGFGKIRVKGNELDLESLKKIQFGKGPLSISAASSYGDVKISFVE